MDMSAAALPPRQPHISDAARSHPDFSAYMAYRSSCNRLMIEASRFDDWIAQRDHQKYLDDWSKHPLYADFLAWMRETKGGAKGKKSPGAFPENFKAWLGGARW
jgi:hypothetical protein